MLRLAGLFAVVVCALSLAGGEMVPVVIPSAAAWVQWADFNGDGLDDLVSRDGLQWNLGGTFSAPVAIGYIPEATADFNGDGFADLVLQPDTERGFGAPRLLLGTGDGHFVEQAFSSEHGFFYACGDFSGDGKPDLVMADMQRGVGGMLTLLRSNGDGTFRMHQRLPWVQDLSELNTMIVGDVGGDGWPDLVQMFGDRLLIWYGRRDGHFDSPVTRYTVTPAASLVAGDVNGDGHSDLTFIHQSAGTHAVNVLYGDGGQRFPVAARHRVSDEPTSAVLVDLGGGATGIAYAQQDGAVHILATRNGTLTETSVARLDPAATAAREEGVVYPRLWRVSLRRPGRHELVAEGSVYPSGHRVRRTLWEIPLESSEVPRASGRRRATGISAVQTLEGAYDMAVASTCPFTMANATLRREGMFVGIEAPNVESSEAAYLDGKLHVRMTISENGVARAVKGTLRANANGFEGWLHEPDSSICGAAAAHQVKLTQRLAPQ